MRCQFNGIARARLFAHAAVDAAQFVDIELLWIFLAVIPRTLFRDDMDAIGRTRRRAHHARHASHAPILVLVESMHPTKSSAVLSTLFDRTIVTLLFRVLQNPNVLLIGAIAPKVLECMAHRRAKSLDNVHDEKPLGRVQSARGHIHNIIVANRHSSKGRNSRGFRSEVIGHARLGYASMMSPRSKELAAAETRIGWRMFGLGWLMTTEVIAGALLGWGFDVWQGTEKTGLMVGAGIGVLVGMYSLIRGAFKANNALDALERKSRGINNEIKSGNP